MSKSQLELKQDLTIVSFFNGLKNLYFLDIGAYDGETISNTYLLEKKYDWTGICSEPLPSAFSKLVKCRDVHCDNNAVFSKTGLSLEFSESEVLSGITEYIASFKEDINSNKITVNTITLQDLLIKYKAPKKIDYLSLDTEGTELEILKSVNLSEYTFLYINVEHNYIEPRRSKIKSLLENNGYLYKGENKWDDDYIHESTIIGNYYLNNDYTKPILIKRVKSLFSVSSPYWKDDIGQFKNGTIKWSRLGEGTIYYTHINYENGNIWYRDNRQ